MLKNYFKIAWRNLIKNKSHSFINILGLSVGLACSLLILLWVQNELSMDDFHKNGNRLYTVYERQYYDHKIVGQYNVPGQLSDELKKQIPEIQFASNEAWPSWNTFQLGEKIIKFQGNYVGADFFQMFSYPFLQGDSKTALSTPSGIVLSRKMANAFFGSPQAAIGKTIRYENKQNFTVTGVYEDTPNTSTERADYFINWFTFLDENSWAKQWGNNGPNCYMMLRADANPALVERKLSHLLDNLNKEQKKGTFTEDMGMLKYSSVYLHGKFTDGKIDGGRIEYVRLFSIVAIFILLIACINFMKLTTARSVKRAREIGVRKVVGALRGSLIKQFIGESLLLTSVAVIIALLLVIVLLPLFNSITQKQIELPFDQPFFWLNLIAITLITGFIAGSYPALFLSSFNPIKVLKGTLKLEWGTVMFRKGLVIFQFVLSIVLILGTIVISRQINYIQSKNLGFDRDNLVYISLSGDLKTKYNLFKTEALKMPGIQDISRISDDPTNIENGTGGVNWTGKDPNLNIEFTQAAVSYDFMRTMKLKMVQGRDSLKILPLIL